MSNNNNLRIHFIGLDTKETAVFERVISFNISHGLKAEIIDNIQDADLSIVADTSFNAVEHLSKNKTIVVIANNDKVTDGDFQISRPLMITKVMNLLTEAIEKAKTKKNVAPSSSASPNDDIKIASATDKSNTTVDVESETPSHSHHALIIDDSAAIRKQLELELRDAGISSDFSICGEDALEKIKDNHFDLVFLDIIMPGLDGYETCKAMRSNPAYKKTPIIMLSGKTAPLDEVKGVIAGATTYLTKPVKSDRLQITLNRVRKWIDNYAPARKSESESV